MRPRLSEIAVFGMFLVGAAASAAAQRQQPHAAQTGVGRPCGAAADVVPGGLVVVLPSGRKSDPSLDLQALKNPYVSGVALRINWRELEPVEGQIDWSRLDALFAAAETAKKWCTSSSSPASSLRHGHWLGRRPICSRSSMDPATAPKPGCRCRGIACTSTAGLRF
jgi:hypothetical protein